MRNDFQVEIEPDAPEVLPAGDPAGELVLARSLPEGFNLPALLRFLPDVRLKQRADALAADALAIDVTVEGGLVAADEALAPLRESVTEIETCFEDPTSLANQLHKRLTGLRTDFCTAAKAALETVSKRIAAEKRRLDQVALEAQRAAQAAADKQARADAQKAADAAKAAGQSKTVVAQLKEQAKVAVAPPVASPVRTPVLASTSVVAKWKARFVGSPADADPNPEVADMTADQQEQLRRVLLAVGNGQLPLAVCAGLDWSYLNKRAAAEKKTFEMPQLEAFDEGGTRKKR